MPRNNIRYSRHAVQRKLERNITDRLIKQTLENLDYTISHGVRKIAERHSADKNVRVVYIEEETYIKIITVY